MYACSSTLATKQLDESQSHNNQKQPNGVMFPHLLPTRGTQCGGKAGGGGVRVVLVCDNAPHVNTYVGDDALLFPGCVLYLGRCFVWVYVWVWVRVYA